MIGGRYLPTDGKDETQLGRRMKFICKQLIVANEYLHTVLVDCRIPTSVSKVQMREIIWDGKIPITLPVPGFFLLRGFVATTGLSYFLNDTTLRFP